jgi:hypothetical protein
VRFSVENGLDVEAVIAFIRHVNVALAAELSG